MGRSSLERQKKRTEKCLSRGYVWMLVKIYVHTYMTFSWRLYCTWTSESALHRSLVCALKQNPRRNGTAGLHEFCVIRQTISENGLRIHTGHTPSWTNAFQECSIFFANLNGKHGAWVTHQYESKYPILLNGKSSPIHLQNVLTYRTVRCQWFQCTTAASHP